MLDIVVEVATNLFQSFMYVGFLYLFFEKPDSKKKNIICFFAFVTIFFSVLNLFLFFHSYAADFSTIACIIILELYTLLCLRSNIIIRIVMPIFSLLISNAISYTFAYLVSYFSGVSYYNLATNSSVYRLTCIIVFNITNALVFLIILKFKNDKINIKKWTDFTAFLVVPILALCIIYSTFYIVTITEFRSDILPFLIAICICMAVITVIVWLMITRISKDNEIKTKLLIMEQKEELYRNDILNTNNQIQELSRVKHDIKNHLLCIDGLISDKKYDEAKGLCSQVSENLSRIYTPVNTENPLLNAVVNVELEKALKRSIDFYVQINNNLSYFSHNSDIVSIIGNLCDNAIEYLEKLEVKNRKMKLEITSHNDYCIIVCSNKITNSILRDNPNLLTTKEDKRFHGKGIDILRVNVEKYSGELKYYEKDGYFTAAVVLKLLIIPENR